MSISAAHALVRWALRDSDSDSDCCTGGKIRIWGDDYACSRAMQMREVDEMGEGENIGL